MTTQTAIAAVHARPASGLQPPLFPPTVRLHETCRGQSLLAAVEKKTKKKKKKKKRQLLFGINPDKYFDLQISNYFNDLSFSANVTNANAKTRNLFI
ncbi:hypothetical protein F2P81_008336 [Scophthalmus maximus]|uniref:Uncharacterized protein n=1 Tax=Scophthalmus maximus TaxID=52904 RepID=A0A6A4TAZ7_SCOMX|nr:hypothetical protein F2P81_008336 [Scophthalmus maximus]